METLSHNPTKIKSETDMIEINSPQFDALMLEFKSDIEKTSSKKGVYVVGKIRGEEAQLSYETFGTGPKKILFIMGLNATGSHWSFQSRYFGNLDQYQICVFDNRGIGSSTATSGPYTTTMLAHDAFDLLDHLGWEKEVNIIGVSMGGMVAQHMGIRQPARFSSIVFTSTYNSAALVVPTPADLKLFFKMISRTRAGLIRPLIKICFPKQWLQAEAKPGLTNFEFLELTLKELSTDSPHRTMAGEYSQGVAALFHNIAPYRLKALKRAGIRCLVLHGSKDKVIRPAYGDLLSSILECPKIQFRNSGHMLMIERCEEYNFIIRAHIEEVPLDTYLKSTGIELVSDVKDKKAMLMLTKGVEDKSLEEVNNEQCESHKPNHFWLGAFLSNTFKPIITRSNSENELAQTDFKVTNSLKSSTIPMTNIHSNQSDLEKSNLPKASKSFFSKDNWSNFLSNHTFAPRQHV